jgi:hypothetical protein
MTTRSEQSPTRWQGSLPAVDVGFGCGTRSPVPELANDPFLTTRRPPPPRRRPVRSNPRRPRRQEQGRRDVVSILGVDCEGFSIWFAMADFANTLFRDPVGKVLVDRLISTSSCRVHRAINP